MGTPSSVQSDSGLTAQEYADALLGSTNPRPETRDTIADIADLYGLKFIGYEVGAHDTRGTRAVLDAQMLPEVGEAYEQYYVNLFKSGMDEVNQFAVGSRWHWGTYGGANFAEAVWAGATPASAGTSVQNIGVWGLTPGTHTSNTPKYEAAVRVARMYTTT